MVKISPSILSSDYGNLENEVKRMKICGADMIHIDVMDGHFVPNITLGAPIVKCIRKAVDLPFDVHLMISDPYKYTPDFVGAGADIITFHIEADSDTEKTIDLIRASGVSAGLAVKPKTDVEEVFPYLEKLSMVLVMTVEPGFGGQSFMYETMPKIEKLKAEIDRRGLIIDIQVDGGINGETIVTAAKAGANVFVAGNAIFSSADAKSTISEFRRSATI